MVRLIAYFKQVFWLLVINFTIKPIWILLIDSKLQILYGPEHYGNFFSLMNQVYILSIFLDLGIHNYTTQKLASKTLDISEVFSKMFRAKILLIGIYFMLVLAVVFLQDLKFEQQCILILLAINQTIFSLFQWFRAIFQGLQKFALDKWLSSIDRIFLVFLGTLLIFLYKSSSFRSFWAYLGLYTITYLCSLFFSFWILKNDILYKEKFDNSNYQILPILKSALPYTAIVLLMSLYTRMDGILLQKLIPDGNFYSNQYAFSYRIIDSAYNSLYLLSVFLMPSVARLNKEQKSKEAEQQIWVSALISTIMALGFIVLSSYFADWIYLKVYNITDYQSIQTFKIAVWGVLGIAWMYVFGAVLLANEDFKPIIWIVGVACILGIVGFWYAIPNFYTIGAASVASFIQLFVGTGKALAWIYHHYFKK